MRIIAVVAVAAVLGALPAVAQAPCRITNSADGKQSSVSGDVTGTSVAMLVTENGPFPAKLTLDAESAYKPAADGPATLNMFRVGNSLEGKDWMQPGSVETVDGGLLMRWPGFTLKGARVRNLSVEVSSGWTKKRQEISYPVTHAGPDALFLRLDARLATPAGSMLVDTNYSELTQWRNAVIGQAAFRVDIFDADAGVHIAKVDFTLPEAATIQARLISDVTALRRAVADKSCK